jgi:hypothetical protein
MENPASDSSFPQDECKQHVGLALIESIQLQPFTLIDAADDLESQWLGSVDVPVVA